MIERGLLLQAMNHTRDGITISDARMEDNPLIFVNPAFERLTGYTAEEAVGKNCRYLQGTDREQPAISVIGDAVRKGEYCLATLRNYRKDGSMFWNELSLSPVFDDHGELTHFIGVQKDVTERALLEEELKQSNRELERANKNLIQLTNRDSMTGVYNRRYFDSQLFIHWNIVRRSRQAISLFMIDVDHFKGFNDLYGHRAGDDCLRKVAKTMNRAFRRASDFLARYGGEEFVVLTTGMTPARAKEYAEALCESVRRLEIPHDKSTVGRLTISVGFITREPRGKEGPGILVRKADEALYEAKQQGRDRAVCAD